MFKLLLIGNNEDKVYIIKFSLGVMAKLRKLKERLDALDKWGSKHKKRIILPLLAIGIGLSGFFGFLEYKHQKYSKEHPKIYGNLLNPSFTIRTQEELFFSPLEQELAAARPQYAIFEEISNQLDKLQENLKTYQTEIPVEEKLEKERGAKLSSLEAIKEYLDEDEPLSKYGEIKREFRDDLLKLDEYGLPLQLSFVDFNDNSDTQRLLDELELIILTRRSIRDKESRYGDFSEFSERLFQEMTGKKKPASLEIKLKDIKDEKVLGVHDALNEKIEQRDKGYESSLLTRFHELGHASYQGQEETYVKRTEEVKFLEESAAYLFEIAGSQMVKKQNQELGDSMEMILSINRIEFIKEYSQGSNEEHAVGWAFANALINYFKGDIKESFNYISTRNKLNQFDPAIIRTFESYRQGIHFDGSDIKNRKEELDERIKQLRIEYMDLDSQYISD